MLSELLTKNPLILAEGAIAEQLRRMPEVELHPTLFNTPLIYARNAIKSRMTALYEEYLEVASAADLPLLLTAPTWRLDARRVAEAEVPSSINTDAVKYLCEVRDRYSSRREVLVGALVGPKEDCYRPELSPSAEEAADFHSPQLQELAASQAQFLQAQTIPSLREGLGIARAASGLGKPYIISFCAGPDGAILDGTRLNEAMEVIDQTVEEKPLGYAVSCTYPSFLNSYPQGSLDRLIGIQANGSAKDVTRLDGSGATTAEPVEEWARVTLSLHRLHQVKILGGCCGTSAEHLRRLVALTRKPPHSGEVSYSED
ncbi:MAG: homocysteine S-methyltransferase family protein [Candidatus Eremiobacteraeota bacterium]|nr:homocysteine S-methyltransferase family protein [Candidatus Eremiobacteraeota bacterium]